MLTIDKLKEFGANAEEGLARCMNNEALYFRLIGMAVAEPSIEALGNALDAEDFDKAFEEAHKLKGAMGNLSLNPIFNPISELTELLRHKEQGDYKALYNQSLEKINELKTLLD